MAVDIPHLCMFFGGLGHVLQETFRENIYSRVRNGPMEKGEGGVMDRDELQELIIKICKEEGAEMNYVISGIIADAIISYLLDKYRTQERVKYER